MPLSQRRQIHLDTDIGGDPDDLCALALLLASPDVDLVGVTTVADSHGLRASTVWHVLDMVGRTDIPVASGAFDSLKPRYEQEPPSDRDWPGLVRRPPTPPGEAIDLLLKNAAAGATVVGIGPFTNLAIAEAMRPGILAATRVVLMGGFVRPAGDGFPAWNSSRDWNTQVDTVASRIVFERANPVLVPIETTVRTSITRRDVPRLQAAGRLGAFIAHQEQRYGSERRYAKLAAQCPSLPSDLLNFQHDPLAAAVAMDWDCATLESLSLDITDRDGVLALVESPGGKPFEVATGVDAEAFAKRWLDAVASLKS